MKKILLSSVVLACASVSSAQDYLLAGFSFSQFLGSGAPSIDGQTFETVGSISAVFRGASLPDPDTVDGFSVGGNGTAGYVGSFANWAWAGFDKDLGVDVSAFTFGGAQSINSDSVHSAQQLIWADQQGAALTFQKANTLWDITVDTAGYTNAGVSDLTFAAVGVGGAAEVEWVFNGSVFATSTISGSLAAYEIDLPAAFYGSTDSLLQGRLISGTGVTFDNVQFNGSAIPEPSTYAALAGVAGLALAAVRRRKHA